MRVKLPILSLALASLSLAASWRIDTAHSSAGFSVRHMMVSNVRGQFAKVSGTIEYDAANVAATKIDATIEAASIDTQNEKRDTHLRSADFLDVEKFPTLRFVSKKVERAGEGKLKVTGDLSLHGVTKEVVLDVDGPSAEVMGPGGTPRIGASAATKINRKDFGVVWDRKMDGGGVVVGDQITITIDVELIQSK